MLGFSLPSPVNCEVVAMINILLHMNDILFDNANSNILPLQ